MEVLYCALGNLAGHHWVKGSSGHFCCDHAKARLRNHVLSHLVCVLPPVIPGQMAAAKEGRRSPEGTRKTASLFELLTKIVHYLLEPGHFPSQVGHFVFELRQT